MLTPLSAFSSLRAYAIQRRPAAAVFTLPLILLASAAAGLTPAAALATDGPASSTLSVVGTSDVSDSGLFANLIKPMFQQAYPQYTITYKGEGTSKAIADAKTGNYSALLVHAASVENQFVSSGYSAEPYGRAVFYGDFVMLGPTGTTDPAGVLANAPHDMVKAFQDIATAGETSTPTADFVSRADGSGTNIEEHLIWAMTTGVPLCTVPSANGGGDEPAGSSDSGQTCPEYTGTASSIVLPNYPDWYHAGASTQSANISVANTCSPSVGHGSSNDCYVFTDRGTYDCLEFAACETGAAGLQAPVGAPSNLQIVTRNNSGSAVGGNTLLVNSFHAYAVNPTVSPSTINNTAAEDFLNFLQSPAFQALLASFPFGTTTPAPDTPPFLADASPTITASALPSVTAGGAPVTVTGSLDNAVPGTPALANQPVTLSETSGALAAGVPVSTATTNANGDYSLTFTPTSSGSYQVTTGQITQIENASLTPIFGDLLAPASTTPATIAVQGGFSGLSATPIPGSAIVSGAVQPGSGHASATVTVLARPHGSTGAFAAVSSTTLSASQSTFAIAAPLGTGYWDIEASFADPGQVLSATSAAIGVVVPAVSGSTPPSFGFPGVVAPTAANAVSIASASLKTGELTLDATLTPAPVVTGGKLELLGLPASAVTETKPARKSKKGKGKKASEAAATGFKVIDVAPVPAEATAVTLHHQLKRRERWILQLEYLPPNKAAAVFSKLRPINVH